MNEGRVRKRQAWRGSIIWAPNCRSIRLYPPPSSPTYGHRRTSFFWNHFFPPSATNTAPIYKISPIISNSPFISNTLSQGQRGNNCIEGVKYRHPFISNEFHTLIYYIIYYILFYIYIKCNIHIIKFNDLTSRKRKKVGLRISSLPVSNPVQP